MVASDDVFNSIGVDEDGVHYFCCDDQAFDVWVVGRIHLRILSEMNNRLWITNKTENMYAVKEVTFK